jgi:hypothetical protein
MGKADVRVHARHAEGHQKWANNFFDTSYRLVMQVVDAD